MHALYRIISFTRWLDTGLPMRKRVFFALAHLSVAFAVLAPRAARAQVASDAAGVSVMIKAIDITWYSDPAPDDYFELGTYSLNGSQTVSTIANTSETPQMIARMVVGRTYSISLIGDSVEGLVLQAVPPAGYVMEIERVARERYETGVVPTVSVRVRPSADAAPSRAGVATALGVERTLWQLSLGSLANGESAGALAFIEPGYSFTMASLFTPGGLVYDPPSSDVVVIRNGPGTQSPYVFGTIRQIITPQVCVDVYMDSSNQCQIKVFHRAQLGTLSNGVYNFSGDPFAWYFFNQDGAVPNAVIISCYLRNITGSDANGNPTILPGGQPIVRGKITRLLRSGTSPNFTWTANDWFEAEPPLPLNPLNDIARARDGATETLTVAPHGGNAISQLTRSYSSQPWGEEVTQETLGTTAPVTTNYTYWDMAGSGGDQSAAHTRLRSRSSHGSWEVWEYYSIGVSAWDGRLQRRHRPFKNSNTSVPTNLGAHGGEITSYQWAPDVFGRATRPTHIETTVNGVTTAKTEIAYSGPYFSNFTGHPALTLITATRKDYSAAGTFLTTTTKYFSEHSGANGAPLTDDFFRLRLHSVQQPDGVKQSFAYQRGTWNGSAFTLSANNGLDVPSGIFASRTSVILGVASGGTSYPTHEGYDIDDLGLIDGKSTLSVTIRDNYARVVRSEIYVRSGGWHLVSAVNYRWSFANQLIKRATNQSTTYDLGSGAIYEAGYNGEHLTSETGETGIVTTYTYDAADRVDIATQAAATGVGELTTKFQYDAAGRVKEQRVWGQTGQSHQIITSRSFDMAGRLSSETQPGPNGGMTTTFSYDPANRQVTVSLPNGGSRTNTYHADGTLNQITGTAAIPAYFTYDVHSATGVRYSRVNIGSSNSTRLRETWSDWLGRATQSSHPGFTGQPAVVEGGVFDPISGRLTKSTRTGYANTLYQYDAFGQLTRTGLDLNGNDIFDLSGTDRIGESDVSFQFIDNAWWSIQVAKTYPTAGSGTPLTLSTTRARLTAFTATLPGFGGSLLAEARSTGVDGNTTTVQTFVDRGNKTTKVVTTVTNSQGNAVYANSQIETLVNGLPTSVRRFDGLTYTTGYDALLRPSTSTDPRTGTTTTYYKTGSTFVLGVWGPIGASGNEGYLASYTYDNAGRAIAVTDAANKVTRTEYNALDQVVRRWGDGSHPVEFGYNSLGERTILKTYRGGSNWSAATWPAATTGAADQTTWNYDGPSGLLASKVDALNRSVAYTYNNRGQTSQRTWARGVVTTYGYHSSTGELTSQTYSDGTPNVSYAYTRAGQLGSVTDHTGMRTLAYGAATGSHALQLDTISLSSYYGSRVLSQHYDEIKRAAGFRLGTSGAPSADLSQTHGYSSLGRFESVASASSAQSSRTFSYSYNTGGLVSGMGASSSTFAVTRAYEPYRDLLTSIDSKWDFTSRTRYDYTYNALAQRATAKQSGDAFADFGGSTYYRYIYNDRGELMEAVNYLGEDPAITTSPQLTGRRFGYSHDNIGNRLSATRALGTSLNDVFSANALNQYSSRENDVAYVAGTAQTTSTIGVTGGTAAANVGRAGRYWGAELTLNNPGAPVKADLSITATLPGSPPLVRTETRAAYLAQALQSFSYDLDGNLIGDGIWTYVYDAENRLVQMTTTGVAVNAGFPNRTLEFKYDYLGRRVQKRSLNQTAGTDTYRRYLYAGHSLVAEFDAPGGTSCGSLLKSYTWGLDLAGSLSATGGVGALVQITDHASSLAYFPTYDGNGNIAALLRASDGVAVAKYEYSPFGELLRCEGAYAKENPFRFSTKFTDDESGLVYYSARFYSPSLGRFVNRDPMGEAGGLNLYGFCGNDGVNGIDYLGFGTITVNGQTFTTDDNGNFSVNGHNYTDNGNGTITRHGEGGSVVFGIGSTGYADWNEGGAVGGLDLSFLGSSGSDQMFGPSRQPRAASNETRAFTRSVPPAVADSNRVAPYDYRKVYSTGDSFSRYGRIYTVEGFEGPAHEHEQLKYPLGKVLLRVEGTDKVLVVPIGTTTILDQYALEIRIVERLLVFAPVKPVPGIVATEQAATAVSATNAARSAAEVSATSAAQASRLRTQLAAEEIAGGHAYGKHVIQQAEFPTVSTPKQFAGEIERIMANPSEVRHLSGGRTAYWDNATQTVVIRNPRAADGGTTFKPVAGKAYFDNLK
jgi:RHS repeat-associated protein